MKRWIVPLLAAAALVAAVPVLAVAASRVPPPATMSSLVNREVGMWQNGSISTTSQSWQPMAALVRICSIGEVSATVSLEGGGGPMGVRVVVNDGPTAQPGAVRFTPNGVADTASFTFLVNTGTFEGYDGHYLQVWWRSPFGAKTTLLKATMNLVYQEGSHRCPA